jgi:hypothetical protein
MRGASLAAPSRAQRVQVPVAGAEQDSQAAQPARAGNERALLDHAYTGHGRLVTALLDEQVHRGLASRRSFCANSQVGFILSAPAVYATGGQRCPKVRLPVFRELMFAAKRRAERAGDVATVIQAPRPASAFLSEQDRLLLASLDVRSDGVWVHPGVPGSVAEAHRVIGAEAAERLPSPARTNPRWRRDDERGVFGTWTALIGPPSLRLGIPARGRDTAGPACSRTAGSAHER